MGAPASSVAVVATVVVCLCGAFARAQAQDMDNEWAWPPYRGFFGAPGSLLPQSDVDLLEFPLNLEYLETEFFCWSALGYGLDAIDANLTGGGPPSIGMAPAGKGGRPAVGVCGFCARAARLPGLSAVLLMLLLVGVAARAELGLRAVPSGRCRCAAPWRGKRRGAAPTRSCMLSADAPSPRGAASSPAPSRPPAAGAWRR